MAKRPKRGITVLGIAALVGIMVGMDWIETRIDMWQYPWGYAVGGRPALPGTWVGLVTTAGGLRTGILLDLRLTPVNPPRPPGSFSYSRSFGRGRNATTLSAKARTCDDRGEQLLSGPGSTADKKASHIWVALNQADSSFQPDGFAISGMDASWDGADALAATALPYWRVRRIGVIRRDDPNVKETPFALERGTEADYRAICRQIGAMR